MIILALESSCDDTSVALVEDGRRVLSCVSASQVLVHTPFGGVLPEAAAREHLMTIHPTIQAALDAANLTMNQIDAIAATIGPGLIGSLLIGANVGKALSLITGKPFLGVNHLYGHVASAYLESDIAPPFLCLLVSGGHTQLIHVKTYQTMSILGETLDDAVGEAYDKVARLVGLAFPGGPLLDKLAHEGNAHRFQLPIAVTQRPWDFSFSGLKTNVSRQWAQAISTLDCDSEASFIQTLQADMAASFQRVAVKALLDKTLACARALTLPTISIAGGVAANSALRAALMQWQEQSDPVLGSIRGVLPPLAFCTDNAAMIGASAYFNPITQDVSHDVFSRMA
ncbi:MAG: tRNA (adenosine(37)-N6)-threonylcarbamoyltransferase complex transferase subunit TsaD [Vampirovibrionales bacterium]|nr:tRNA (adenosine(37)-N6)-threonylcarbamoyltransferase complex transferase subunit TsaD [Vampirovibrionales bacterium]